MRKNFKVVTLGDIHFGAEKSTSHFMNELNDIFLEHIRNNHDDIDAIFLAGDYFHRVLNLNESEADAAFKFMDELLEVSDKYNIALRMIRGTRSHDYNQLDMFEKYTFTGNHDFQIYNAFDDEKMIINMGLNKQGEHEPDFVLHVLYLPEEYPMNEEKYYSRPSRYDENIPTVSKDTPDNTYDIIIGHGMLDYASFESSNVDKTENENRSMVTWDTNELMRISKGPIEFGHIHNYQAYKNTAFYTTSFTTHNFGDKKPKGFLETEFILGGEDGLDIDDWIVRHIDNSEAPVFKTINIDKAPEDEEGKLKYIAEEKKTADYVRIISSNSNDVRILKKATSEEPDIKISIKTKETANREVDPDLAYLVVEDEEHPLSIEEKIYRYIHENMEDDSDITLDTIKLLVNKGKDVTIQDIIDTQSEDEK